MNDLNEGAHDKCAPEPCPVRLEFDDLSHVVELTDSDGVADALATVLPAWGIRQSGPARPLEVPTTIIQGDGDRYSFRSWWSQKPMTRLGLAGATCGAVADLVQAYLDARPGVFGLHCGAVRVGGQLIAFTGTYRAGKTTLVTRLGLEPGCELFCDDVLPIVPQGAVALGIQPRLRLPLPDAVSGGFRDYVNENLTIFDHRYGYVDLPSQAQFGTTAPLSALILLSRQQGERARFHKLETSEAAAHLIRQNIADPGEVEDHYDQVAALAQGMTCLTLVYSDIEEAVALVCKAFGEGAAPRITDLGPPLDLLARLEESEPADLDCVFGQSEGVVERIIGADTFLWQMDGRNFFSLNPVGGAIWALLEDSASGADIASALHDVFPDAPIEMIQSDLSTLLGQMRARGLVECHDG